MKITSQVWKRRRVMVALALSESRGSLVLAEH